MFLNRCRKSGIFLHISSLPGNFCIGDLGPGAERFAEFLSDSGFSVWQVLPMTPVNSACGNSPYCSQSAFAGNFLFISPEKMSRDGLISCDDMEQYVAAASSKSDYIYAEKIKHELLVTAWRNFCAEKKNRMKEHEDYRNFREKEKWWLDDYVIFTVLKEHFGGMCWNEWPENFRNRDENSLRIFISEESNAESIDFYAFVQYIFYRQWHELHEYCSKRGISIIGDIPMFVALDSSDVWSNRELFNLRDDGSPGLVAGVPPDYFSSTGQRWGNPVYRWDRMEENGFRWWIMRIRHALKIYDSARVDHFRGFCAYWAIPPEDKTAQNGKWVVAPGRSFFRALDADIRAENGKELNLIAEDLGIITDDVRELMAEFRLPGMKVLLFAFCDATGANPYAPHNISSDSVVYTGTHDNNTAAGWWKNETSECDRRRFRSYIGYDIRDEDVPERMLIMALSSHADLAVIPMQDILGLDETARMNTPGKPEGNWEWRLERGYFLNRTSDAPDLTGRLKELNIIYGRSG